LSSDVYDGARGAAESRSYFISRILISAVVLREPRRWLVDEQKELKNLADVMEAGLARRQVQHLAL